MQHNENASQRLQMAFRRMQFNPLMNSVETQTVKWNDENSSRHEGRKKTLKKTQTEVKLKMENLGIQANLWR